MDEREHARLRGKLPDLIGLQSYGEPDDLPLERSALRHLRPEVWTKLAFFEVPKTVGDARQIARVLRREARRARGPYLAN